VDIQVFKIVEAGIQAPKVSYVLYTTAISRSGEPLGPLSHKGHFMGLLGLLK